MILPLAVIALTGQSGTGKSTLAHILATDLNGTLLGFGDFVRSEATRRVIPLNRVSLQTLGQELVDTLGSVKLVRQVLAEGPQSGLIILDGVRSVAVWEALKAMTQHHLLVYLCMADDARLNRLQQRDGIDREQAQSLATHPLEQGIVSLAPLADIVLQEPFDHAKLLTDLRAWLHDLPS